ncbi:MAG: DUF4340 domain-containing protein [Clostridia bacterium]|nr:DUF4340 domain-containing protein [Clostridia bacterium]
MKNKPLLIALALLLVLVGVYAAMTLGGSGEDEHGNEQDLEALAKGDAIVLTEHDVSRFERFSYSFRDGETLAFTYSVKGWSVEGDPEYPIDYFLVEDILEPLCDVTASRLLTSDASLKAQYGLEPAAITVELRDMDGVEYTYYIGDKHPTTHQYYFNIEGQDEIYMVPTGVAINMAKYDSYGSLIVTPDFPVASMSATESVVVARGTETDTLVRLSEGSDSCYTSEYTWFYEGEDGLQPLDETSFTNYFNAVAMPTVQYAVDYSKDPAVMAKYGLAEGQEQYTVTVTHEDASEGVITEVYYIGQGEDGKSYCRLEGSGVIGSIINKYEFFDFNIDTYRACDFFKMKTDTIDKMVISLEGQRHVVEIDRSGEDETCTVNGAEADSGKIAAFVNALRNTVYEGKAEGVPEGEPYMQVDFTRSTGTFSEMTLRLWEFDSNFYISEFAGNTLLINKRDVEGISEALAALVAR